MSQLYKLFCEGLHSRSAEKDSGLSSTLIITSTPLADENQEDDADDAGFVCEMPQIPQMLKAPSSSGSEVGNEIPPEKESPNLSVQGQVGSAITESNEATDSNNALNPPSPRRKTLQFSQKKVNDDVDERLSHNSSEHLQQKNVNVSPVDFVDRIIAARNRENGVGRRNRSVSSSSDSTESEVPTQRHGSRKRISISDSSETDFEGANELNQKLSSNLLLSPKSGNNAKKRLRENREGTTSTDSGSNINLVIDNTISSPADTSSETQTSVEIEPGSPSAARCRVFHKTGANINCSAERNSEKVVSAGLIQNLPSQNMIPQYNYKQSTKENINLSDCLQGVVAYVEVRSGHDNRSMGVRTQLRALGATVVEKMSKEVTHVIFNEGSPTTLRLAKEQGCHLVSVLWIDECKKLRALAPEDEHPPLNMQRYEQPGNLKKYRKMKSLQPDFEDGKGEERLNRYIKKYRSKVRRALQSRSQNDKETSSEDSECDVHQPSDVTNKQQNSVLPNGIKLKELSVVLNKINTVGASGISVSAERRHKRRLMPLQTQVHLSQPLENFEPDEHFRPENPYTCPSLRKQNTLPSSKRMMKRSTTSRRSSCFVRTTQGSMRSQYTQKKTKPQMRTMVCTFMHRREIDVVAAVIKQLGGWILEPTVSPKTTHVVCGDSKRTINLLRGIAHGCWILHQEWASVMRSLEAGHWLGEEPFELNAFPAIQQCRVARETFGVSPDIFSSAGAIFVSKDTTPPRSDLVDLLTLCGGNVVNSARQARLIIGPYQRRSSFSNVAFVKELWVLDSIQENMLQPLRRYYH
ncbi:Microcephalin [Frankliniella fusca]|uniref:Microcephalin n=1 Tax=Frankliniella fusca TaxID=407009 RepID=A0AAE1HH96_9NEOP|nr:Microcephalin [Frankliniella fusca]